MKTNMGQKWYQLIVYDLPLFRWTFFVIINLKNVFQNRNTLFEA
jgi:hypothetical protein